jgi:hypothetical protein
MNQGRPRKWEARPSERGGARFKFIAFLTIIIAVGYAGYSRKALSFRAREGWRSLRNAFASIWRMRSRVTRSAGPLLPACARDPVVPRPNRILITRSSRGVKRRNTSSVISRRFEVTTASAGFRIDLSSMKSPRCESSSSPIGVSSEIGSCSNLQNLAHLSTGISIFFAISSLVGSRQAPAPARATFESTC